MNDNLGIEGAVYDLDGYINLYYLNELYRNVSKVVSKKMKGSKNLDISLTSGIWGGTYLIANDLGVAKNRVQRLYCIVNMPRRHGLEDKNNMDFFMKLYAKTCIDAFEPHGLKLELEKWGDILPYSNRRQPSLIMHLSDSNKRIRWLRVFFVWNVTLWEESMIYDAIRNIKVLKELLNLDIRPMPKETEELKFLMQDVIIVYRTLEKL